MRQQKSVAQFELRLREKAEVCEFGATDRVDRVILDQLVPNLCNLELKYKLLETGDLTLETALAKAKLFETLRSQVPHMGEKQQTVDNHDVPNSVNSIHVVCTLQAMPSVAFGQGWGICSPCEHMIWSTSEFSQPKLEYNITSKRSSTISRYLDSTSREVSLSHR